MVRKFNWSFIRQGFLEKLSLCNTLIALVFCLCLPSQSFGETSSPDLSLQSPSDSTNSITLKRFKVGDSFSYVVSDIFNNKIERKFTRTVTSVSDNIIEFDYGKSRVNKFGNDVRGNGEEPITFEKFPHEYSVGVKWTSDFINLKDNETITTLEITGRRELTTPIGKFNAFVIEGIGQVPHASTTGAYQFLIDPESCSLPVSMQIITKNKKNDIGLGELYTLTACNQ